MMDVSKLHVNVQPVAMQFIKDKEATSQVDLQPLVKQFIDDKNLDHTRKEDVSAFFQERKPEGLSMNQSLVLECQFLQQLKRRVYSINNNANRANKRAKKRRLKNGIIKFNPPEAYADSGLGMDEFHGKLLSDVDLSCFYPEIEMRETSALPVNSTSSKLT